MMNDLLTKSVGDTVFATGVLALGWFVLGLKTRWSVREEAKTTRGLSCTTSQPG